MPDIGMAEMLIIGVVALIVVGPKDLPMMFRKVGNFVGRARGMARDFQQAMDQAVDDTGIKEIRDTVKKATDLKEMGLDDLVPEMKDYANNFVNDDENTSKVVKKKKLSSKKKPNKKTTKTIKKKAVE